MSGDDLLVIRKQPARRVEIARSFSFKLNLGNYQSADFFCSEKSECAVEDQDEVSAALFAFCKSQVMKAARQFQEEQRRTAA